MISRALSSSCMLHVKQHYISIEQLQGARNKLRRPTGGKEKARSDASVSLRSSQVFYTGPPVLTILYCSILCCTVPSFLSVCLNPNLSPVIVCNFTSPPLVCNRSMPTPQYNSGSLSYQDILLYSLPLTVQG
jgi:hypothetical protein